MPAAPHMACNGLPVSPGRLAAGLLCGFLFGFLLIPRDLVQHLRHSETSEPTSKVTNHSRGEIIRHTDGRSEVILRNLLVLLVELGKLCLYLNIWEFAPLDIFGYLWISLDIIGYHWISSEILDIFLKHIQKKISI